MLIAVLVAAVAFGIYSYRHRFVKANADMFRFLPESGYTLFYADVETLRRSGTLRLLTGTKSMAEPEYREFVRQTQFDYAKDLNAIAAASNGKAWYLLARGEFSWDRLRKYAVARGGNCESGACSLAATEKGRWISFVSIQPDVIGLALSGDRWAAGTLAGMRHPLRDPVPVFPVWMQVSHEQLLNPEGLPLAVRIFAISLQSADRVVLSLGPDRENGGAAFDLRLDASFRNKAAAETVRTQFASQTKMLTTELSHEHAQASAADLTGLLTAGRFEVAGKRVVGVWPVRRELLEALQ